MDIAALLEKLPVIRSWIMQLLSDHAAQAVPIGQLPFKRLQAYYPKSLLDTARVVIVDHISVPPLSKLGLAEFADFEQGDYGGITYLNTCFLRREHAQDEAIYFHELAHVVQWQCLGVDNFLLAYAIGLLEHGYRESPLERMAYSHGERFERNVAPYDAAGAVRSEAAVLSATITARISSLPAQ